jgi:hypothetical protein
MVLQIVVDTNYSQMDADVYAMDEPHPRTRTRGEGAVTLRTTPRMLGLTLAPEAPAAPEPPAGAG